MSKEENKKKIQEKKTQTQITKFEIQLPKEEDFINNHDKNKEENRDNSLISSIIEDFQNEIIAGDFNVDKEKPLYSCEEIEKCFDDIQVKKDKDLDMYIIDIISVLEELSLILNFEDLIVEPAYTFKLFMNSLKKVPYFA